MNTFRGALFRAMGAICALVSACAPAGDDVVLDEARQSVVEADNGLRTINGLTVVNGLRTINGLSTENGLRTLNGVTTVNGLATFNGLRTLNGLMVDCSDRRDARACTGEPDGLLSASTGMMASDEGIETAKYLVRCALPKGDRVRVRDYTGALVTLRGELGLTPEWKFAQCNETCEERISACLMALTNGSGEHVPVELSAENMSIGGGHRYPLQEAAFYGNLFSDPPRAFFCVGDDFETVRGLPLEQRACSGYGGEISCPYVNTGSCNGAKRLPRKCKFSEGSATRCTDDTFDSNGVPRSKSWHNPITTYRTSVH